MVDYGPCIHCSGSVLREKPQAGRRPGICSDACRREHLRKYHENWFAANRDAELARSAKWRQENAEAYKAYFKAHYERNADRIKKRWSDWCRANPGRLRQAQVAYAKANPDVIRRCSRKSRSTRRAIEKLAFVEVIDAHRVFDRDQGVCGICKGEVELDGQWEIDHIIPLSKGGAHAYDNVQLAHRRCNRSKGNRALRWDGRGSCHQGVYP